MLSKDRARKGQVKASDGWHKEAISGSWPFAQQSVGRFPHGPGPEERRVALRIAAYWHARDDELKCCKQRFESTWCRTAIIARRAYAGGVELPQHADAAAVRRSVDALVPTDRDGMPTRWWVFLQDLLDRTRPIGWTESEAREDALLILFAEWSMTNPDAENVDARFLRDRLTALPLRREQWAELVEGALEVLTCAELKGESSSSADTADARDHQGISWATACSAPLGKFAGKRFRWNYDGLKRFLRTTLEKDRNAYESELAQVVAGETGTSLSAARSAIRRVQWRGLRPAQLRE